MALSSFKEILKIEINAIKYQSRNKYLFKDFLSYITILLILYKLL